MDPLYVIPGLLVALAGRRLFWLAFALAGFLLGFRLAAGMVAGPEWLTWAVGVGAGGIAAVMAVFLEGLALAAAAFFAGVLLTVDVAAAFGVGGHPQIWLAWIAGGTVVLVLAMALLPWALAIISAALGGLMVAEGLAWPPTMRLVAFAVVAAAGLLIQVRDLGGDRAPPRRGRAAGKAGGRGRRA